MSENNAILGLLAETSIHAGTGQTVGAIDLPIQREKHTNWPCIYGSAMKGALRAQAESRPSHPCQAIPPPHEASRLSAQRYIPSCP